MTFSRIVDRLSESVTVDDLESLSAWGMAETNIELLLTRISEADRKFYLDLFSKLLDVAERAVAPFGLHVHKKSFISDLLQKEWLRTSTSSYFPLILQVSASASDGDGIGLLLHETGAIEMFEGNDEASAATIQAVNNLLGVADKVVRVYGSHSRAVLDQIVDTGMLPAGLYVSPTKSYAASYWGEDRHLFSCKVPLSAVNQESTVDWRVLAPVKVTGYREGY